MIYFLSITIILFILLLLKFFHLRTISQINLNNLNQYREENSKLHEERISLLTQVEHLKTTLKIKEESQEESLKSSKAVLYDLSNSVVNQLLDIHKKEVNESRKQSEEKIIKSTESFNAELQKVATLVGALNKDVESSKAIVDNLRSALLSPSSSGLLAEVTLENLLKNSGLKQDTDFIIQHSFDGTTNNKLRPDAIIFLPEDNLLVIDAKSSQFLVNSENNDDLSKSMNLHLKNLLSKDYTNEIAQDFKDKKVKIRRISSVMFMPTEQALERINDIDKTFMNRAWQNNIYPVGPAGLMNILSVAKMHISEKIRVDNYENIINEINSLINSIGTISEHAFRLGNSISSAVGNYDKFAASFNRNLISKVKNLKNFGTGNNTKTSKLLERYQIVSSKNDLIEVEDIEVAEITDDREKTQ